MDPKKFQMFYQASGKKYTISVDKGKSDAQDWVDKLCD
jgi:hypothetical protein